MREAVADCGALRMSLLTVYCGRNKMHHNISSRLFIHWAFFRPIDARIAYGQRSTNAVGLRYAIFEVFRFNEQLNYCTFQGEEEDKPVQEVDQDGQ